MPKPPKNCIFCGVPGKKSKEHIFADWLRILFPRDASSTHTFGTIDPYKGIITETPKEKITHLQGHIGTRRLKVVCATCNNNWMSQLEETVKPILIPMITNEFVGLEPSQQQLLSRWAAKTVMVAEFEKPRSDGITQSERTWLKDNPTPPDNWLIWLAGYNGKSWAELAFAQNRGSLQSAPVRRPHIQVHYCQSTIFGMGHALFLVVNSSWDGIFDAFGNIDNDGLIRIWPPQNLSIPWPPPVILGDEQANAVANILTQSGRFDQSLNPLAKHTITF